MPCSGSHVVVIQPKDNRSNTSCLLVVYSYRLPLSTYFVVLVVVVLVVVVLVVVVLVVVVLVLVVSSPFKTRLELHGTRDSRSSLDQ